MGKGGNERIAMNSTGAADVHHNAILAILHAEIRRSCTHQFKWRGVVDGQHGFPLFVRHLSCQHSHPINQHIVHRSGHTL